MTQSNTSLIPLFSGTLQNQSQLLCNARDLWAFVESNQEFANWIKSRIEKFNFVENEDYLVDKFVNNPQGGRPTLDYHLTLDMAKELGMLEANAKGKQIRQYFIECEKTLLQKMDLRAAVEAQQLRNELTGLRIMAISYNRLWSKILCYRSLGLSAAEVAGYCKISTKHLARNEEQMILMGVMGGKFRPNRAALMETPHPILARQQEKAAKATQGFFNELFANDSSNSANSAK